MNCCFVLLWAIDDLTLDGLAVFQNQIKFSHVLSA